MHFVAAVVTDEQSFVVVEPGEGALDDPADTAEARAVLGLAAGADRTRPGSARVEAQIRLTVGRTKMSDLKEPHVVCSGLGSANGRRNASGPRRPCWLLPAVRKVGPEVPSERVR